MALDDETIERLLNQDKVRRTGYPPVPQHGPLRVKDEISDCASKGCKVPTYYKVQGVPYCSIHALRKLNEMLVELGAE